jgi:hypothetical protein
LFRTNTHFSSPPFFSPSPSLPVHLRDLIYYFCFLC